MVRLTFLGTGGGRFTTLFQTRATGGLYIEDDPARFHIDPGPGALTQLHAARLDPTATTGVLVSHAHLDHCNDANLIVEAMTRGGTETRGFLVGSVSVMEGHGGQPPVVTPHHRALVSSHETAKAGGATRVSGRRVEFLPTDHRDPTNVGFKLHTTEGIVTYYTDSIARNDLVEPLKGSRVLVLGVTRPRGAQIPWHLTTDDAADIAEIVGPDLLVLTHLGLKLLRGSPDAEARYVEERTGVRTVAARDLMRVDVGPETIEVEMPRAGSRGRGGHRGRGRGRKRSGARSQASSGPKSADGAATSERGPGQASKGQRSRGP